MKLTKQVLDTGIMREQLQYLEDNNYPVRKIIFTTNNSAESDETCQYILSATKADVCEIKIWYVANGGIAYIGPNIEAGKDKKVKAPKTMRYAFTNFGGQVHGLTPAIYLLPHLEEIDVANLDVSNTMNFEGVFRGVGETVAKGVKINGLDKWDVSRGTNFARMFELYNNNGGPVDLDLPWNTSQGKFFCCMFQNCGQHSEDFSLKSFSNWSVEEGENFDLMFANCGKAGQFSLDLTSWHSKRLKGRPRRFAGGLFFAVQEPDWDKMCNQNINLL